MPRRKATDPEARLTHPIIFRVTETVFKRLEKTLAESDCGSIGEVARKIVSDKPIKCFYIDIHLNPVMEELALIRKELKAIGVNINQLTKRFHQDREGHHRPYYIHQVAEQHQQADIKVARLLILVSKLTKRWLPE